MWQVKRTTSTNKHLQANCKFCERRARLNGNTRRFYTYDTREGAETHCEALNEHGVPLTPADIVDDPVEAVELTPDQLAYIEKAVNGDPDETEWF